MGVRYTFIFIFFFFKINYSWTKSVDDLTSILICFITNDEKWSNSVKLLWVIFRLHKIDCKILTFNHNINDENVRVIENYENIYQWNLILK